MKVPIHKNAFCEPCNISFSAKLNRAPFLYNLLFYIALFYFYCWYGRKNFFILAYNKQQELSGKTGRIFQLDKDHVPKKFLSVGLFPKLSIMIQADIFAACREM